MIFSPVSRQWASVALVAAPKLFLSVDLGFFHKTGILDGSLLLGRR